VEQALINEAEGVDISLNYEITPGEAIQRDLALSAAAQEASAQSAA
jgi:hypothetical protein